MSPRERVQAAMDLRAADRVPVMCQLSIGHMLLQLGVSPVEFWNEAELFADGLVRLREMYDFDGILVSLHGHNPEWSKDLVSIKRTSEGEEVIFRGGRKMLFLFDDLPRPLNHDETVKPSITDFDKRNLPRELDYIPVSQGLHFSIDRDQPFEVFSLLRERVGSEYSIHGEITSPFDYYLDLFSYEGGLMGLIDSPATAKMILGHFSQLLKELANQMCRQGVDAIKISSPFAGSSFISKDFYLEFVLPYERELASSIRNNRVHAYIHTCGAIDDRLELMFESGVSGIECLDPPPLGNVELGAAKERTKGKGFIKGNIDSVNTLLLRGETDILDDAKERLQQGKEGGGFILSTACSVAPRVARSRLQLLREAVERWGRY